MAQPLSYQTTGTTITADIWNANVDAINNNTTAVASEATARANADSSINTQLGKTTANGGISDISSRLSGLDTKDSSQDSAISTLTTRTTDSSTGNSALGERVHQLESTPPGSAITASGFLELADNAAHFLHPTVSKQYQVIDTGLGTYIEFPNPGTAVTVFGSVVSHVYCSVSNRVGVKVEINFNDGKGWQTPSYAPLAGVSSSVSNTMAVSSQYAVGGTPGGTVQIRATAMWETVSGTSGDGFYRAVLYANMLGGNSFTTG